MVQLTHIGAFIAGIASFLSPCVLPLIPGFLAYLSGIAYGDESAKGRLTLFLNSVMFVLGFAVVFAILGVLLNTILESVSNTVQLWLSRFGGIIIIAFGLYVLGIIKIPFLSKEYKIGVKKFKFSYISSFLFGASFAVGWSPCVGAILGSILSLAVTQPGSSFILLMSYTLGLGLPFLLVGLFSSEAIRAIHKYSKFLKYFNIVVGISLVILGILVYTQTLNIVANVTLLNAVLLS